MTKSALIVASPWPRTGTANIFAAQSLFLSSRGYRTAMLLSPHGASYRQKFRDRWAATLSLMRFEGLDLLCNAEARQRTKRWQSTGFFQWLLHGQDSQLAIMARYAAAAALPRELTQFLDNHDLQLMIVNHCFQMGVARKICRYIESRHRPRPTVILETHDVQAELYASGKIENIFRHRVDDLQSLVGDELRLAEAADMMTHVTTEDMDYFKQRLTMKHGLVLATLNPTSERQLLALDSPTEDDEAPLIDFLYVGNNNPGNDRSITWFLTEVTPRLGDAYSIAIVGSIAAHLKATNPMLFARFESYFTGEVPEVGGYYRRAAVVIAPTTFGTGTSIKAIEAMAAGKPIVATATAFRGLPPMPSSAAVRIAGEPDEFAKAMVETRRSYRKLGHQSRALYLELFSNARYFERWDRVLAECGAPP